MIKKLQLQLLGLCRYRFINRPETLRPAGTDACSYRDRQGDTAATREKRQLRSRPGPNHLSKPRQSQIFECERVKLDRSTLSHWVGKLTAPLEPLSDFIGRHLQRDQAIFADDTPVKILMSGTGRIKTARFWAYVRDE